MAVIIQSKTSFSHKYCAARYIINKLEMSLFCTLAKTNRAEVTVFISIITSGQLHKPVCFGRNLVEEQKVNLTVMLLLRRRRRRRMMQKM